MKSSYISCSKSKSAAGFVAFFLSIVVLGVGSAEWMLRDYVFDARNAVGPTAALTKRVAAIYEQRVWPVLGDSRLGDVLVGDSQMNFAFLNNHPGFFQFSLWAETAPMLEILVEQYFKFRKPGRVIVQAGPQLFAQPQLDNGARRHDIYFKQNNWVQHALGLRLYVAEPGVGSFIGEVLGIKLARYRLHLIGPAAAAEGGPTLVAPRHWGDFPVDDRKSVTARRVAAQRPAENFEQTTHFAAYRRLLMFLADSGARICLLRMPVSSEYVELSEGDVQFVKAIQDFRALAASYGRYVDFLDLPMTYSPEYFINQDHLNDLGAATFAPLAIKACFADR